MSYSYTVRAATAALALAAVSAKFDEIVAQQPTHAKDKDAVLANAKNAVEILEVDESRDVLVSGSGFVSWSTDEDGQPKFSSVNIATSASLVAKEPDA